MHGLRGIGWTIVEQSVMSDMRKQTTRTQQNRTVCSELLFSNRHVLITISLSTITLRKSLTTDEQLGWNKIEGGGGTMFEQVANSNPSCAQLQRRKRARCPCVWRCVCSVTIYLTFTLFSSGSCHMNRAHSRMPI